MAGDDDDWDSFESKETVADDREPVPEAVPDLASTGKYQTLTGFEHAAAKEISGARDRLYGRDEVFTAFRLAQIQSGTHPERAQANADLLRAWLNQNEELVRAALKGRG